MMTTNASKTCLRHLAWLVVGLVSTALSAPWPARAQPPSVHAQPMNYGAETRINAQAAARGPAFTGSAVSGLEKVAGGYRVRFTGCDIYTATAGTRAFEVHGEIRDKYNRVGGPNNLGLPVTDEEKADDNGRYNHFSADASIYWHPTTGPKIVRGAIRGGWANAYWEQGTFGYPISDEIGLPGGRAYGDFQDGVLYWEGGFAFQPMQAGLSKDQLASAFKSIFERLLQAKADQAADEFQKAFGVHVGLKPKLRIHFCGVKAVSDYGADFRRSRNRIVTFQLTGSYNTDYLLPDMHWLMEVNLLFYAEKRGGSTQFLVASVGGGYFYALGVAPQDLAEGLRDEFQSAFQQPMDLGTVPQDVEVMSLKITSNGDLIVYIAPSSRNDSLYSWKVDQVQAHLNDFADGND